MGLFGTYGAYYISFPLKNREMKIFLLAVSSNIADYLISNWIEGKLHNVLKPSNYPGDSQITH